MIVTDLDGTLFNSNHLLGEKDRATLEQLGEKGIPRVVATGRILYSVQNVMEEDFPIDYLIFSSGAGIIDFKKMELIYASSMPEESINQAVSILDEFKLNFMIHAPVPDNHFCLYHYNNKIDDQDFKRRLEIYEDFSAVWQGSLKNYPEWENTASIIIASVPGDQGEMIHASVKKKLKGLHVVRTTSPLNPQYNWIEILPKNVSKASAAKWLKEEKGITTPVMGIGNDFNDLDLLNWVDQSYVVSNAPDVMKTSYDVVASNDEAGFSEAVQKFMTSHLK